MQTYGRKMSKMAIFTTKWSYARGLLCELSSKSDDGFITGHEVPLKEGKEFSTKPQSTFIVRLAAD